MNEQERNGTFAAAIRDPFAGGAVFPNNTIPRNRIDPISLRILDLVPLPNNPDPARNFIFNDVPSGRTNRDYAIGRVDYNLSEKDIVYGRYLYNEEEFRSPPTLPIGHGRPFASDVQGAADKIISGWGVRGMTFFQTGLPQNVSMALSRNATCATACAARPDRLGDGNLPKDERTLQRFYDVSAFRVVAAGGADRRVGNAGRNILTSAGFAQYDLQVFKDTRIREGHSLEFRWEMFNAFNHTNWGGAATNMEAPQLFGVISSTRAPRIMQFALRYQF